jgi:hypothetical protein
MRNHILAKQDPSFDSDVIQLFKNIHSGFAQHLDIITQNYKVPENRFYFHLQGKNIRGRFSTVRPLGTAFKYKYILREMHYRGAQLSRNFFVPLRLKWGS